MPLHYSHRRFRTLWIAAALIPLVLSGCGGSGSKPDVTKFCAEAGVLARLQSLDMSNPSTLKGAMDEMVSSMKRAEHSSPPDVKADLQAVISGMATIKKVFDNNDYDQVKVAAATKGYESLVALSTTGFVQAVQRVDSFAAATCDEGVPTVTFAQEVSESAPALETFPTVILPTVQDTMPTDAPTTTPTPITSGFIQLGGSELNDILGGNCEKLSLVSAAATRRSLTLARHCSSNAMAPSRPSN